MNGARTEFRVETRRTASHPYGAGDWWPEGDHEVFTDREKVEAWRDKRADWYGNRARFEHRIVARTVTDWIPLIAEEAPK